MKSGRSVAGRATLAIILMFGFYTLAIGLALGLLYIPYAEVRYAGRLDFRLALFCIVGGGLILLSLIPPRDPFEAPGPPLNESENRELFSQLASVAKLTGQEMPLEVYLIPDVNAWVATRGGIMGFGSRRVMGLGLPLLQILTVTQFRAVLAHEFGHYYGGDTALGPWVYKTRAAIGRTIEGVAQHSSILSKPFYWYGLLFLRLTLRVSRQQELSADELAARTIGARPLTEGLKLIHTAALVFEPYVISEVAPALTAGYRPPVADGFRRFLMARSISDGLTKFLDAAMTTSEEDPYDSHPPLRERITALADSPAGDVVDNDPLALSLLANVDDTEGKLMGFIVTDYAGKGFKPVSWEEMPELVWLPAWRDRAREREKWLTGLTPASISDLAKDNSSLAVQLRYAAYAGVTNDVHRAQAASVFGAALSLALHAAGWRLNAPPGEPVVLESNGVYIKPFSVVSDLSSGDLSAEEWAAICERGGISNLDLGPAFDEPSNRLLKN